MHRGAPVLSQAADPGQRFALVREIDHEPGGGPLGAREDEAEQFVGECRVVAEVLDRRVLLGGRGHGTAGGVLAPHRHRVVPAYGSERLHGSPSSDGWNL